MLLALWCRLKERSVAMALYCAYCGKALPDDAAFCSKCGKALPDATAISAETAPETQATSIIGMNIILPAGERLLYQCELHEMGGQYSTGHFEACIALTNRRLIIRWYNNRLEQVPLHIIRSIYMQGYGYKQELECIGVDIGRKTRFWTDGVIQLHCKDKEQAKEVVSLIETAMLQAEVR